MEGMWTKAVVISFVWTVTITDRWILKRNKFHAGWGEEKEVAIKFAISNEESAAEFSNHIIFVLHNKNNLSDQW